MPISVLGTVNVTDRGGEHVTIGLHQITALGWSTKGGKPHGGTIHLINGMVIHLEADAPGTETADRELSRVSAAWNAYLVR
jgi:hypothetical protein